MGVHIDWLDLVGSQVRVQKEGRTIRTGRVEDVAVSAGLLWLEADGIESRALFGDALGHKILPVPEPVGSQP
ncbi:hypothetical protein GCM10009712_37630 [Pseudarthrobacter sulfonivorans]